MALHPEVELVHRLLKQLDGPAVSLIGKGEIARTIANHTVTLLSNALHKADELERRVRVLEQFPATVADHHSV